MVCKLKNSINTPFDNFDKKYACYKLHFEFNLAYPMHYESLWKLKPCNIH